MQSFYQKSSYFVRALVHGKKIEIFKLWIKYLERTLWFSSKNKQSKIFFFQNPKFKNFNFLKTFLFNRISFFDILDYFQLQSFRRYFRFENICSSVCDPEKIRSKIWVVKSRVQETGSLLFKKRRGRHPAYCNPYFGPFFF